MSITVKNNVFKLDTDNTSYIFCVHRLGFLESLHYGGKIENCFDTAALTEKTPVMTGISVALGRKAPSVCLDTICTEYSSVGKGDYKEPQLIIKNADGTYVNDFRYKGYKIIKGNIDSEGNAASYGAAETLEIELEDACAALTLFLYYTPYENADIITKAAKLVNRSKNKIYIERILSGQIDLPFDDFKAITFDGAWSRERFKNTRELAQGIFVNDSKSGVSGNRHNPFVIYPREECTQDCGECYAVNLIYSGNHYEAAEISNYGKTRLLAGINPYCFRWELKAGEGFLTPEAVFSYSDKGLNGMSRNMHCFVKEHIVRGIWKNKERPIVINSWEAMFFALKEADLIELAELSAELGIELFVLDDGWFGRRDNDKTSLGDWYPHKKKFPEGLGSFADKIRATGLQFGLWVEPEMINEKSELYKKHPEWAVKIDGRVPSLGRNQLEIDFTNSEVRDYIVEALSKIFTDTKLSYVKWDNNRTFSDMYGATLTEQGEFFHKSVLGLYDVMRRLNERFPEVLFESCASGGNRFDLGMLCFMPQTWTSDDTDAFIRIFIQEGTSYGYPLNTMGAHVSEVPNNQTLRTVGIDSRFNVASFGCLGYELDLREAPLSEKKAVKRQIQFYKKHRKTLQYGTFYRLMDGFKGNHAGWIAVSEDKKEAIAFYSTKIMVPNTESDILRLKGLDKNMLYRVRARKEGLPLKPFVKVLTKAVSMVTPFTIKSDSWLAKKLARLVIPSAREDFVMGGDALMNAGIKLYQPLMGLGLDPFHTRFTMDFSSRLYEICAVEK